MEAIQSRIVGHESVSASTLSGMANGMNWRKHPAKQRKALRGILGDVGFIQSVIANKRTGKLVDGHARVAEAMAAGPGTLVPVVWVDLSEDEEARALLQFDAIGSMAKANTKMLAELAVRVGDLAVGIATAADRSEVAYLGNHGAGKGESRPSADQSHYPLALVLTVGQKRSWDAARSQSKSRSDVEFLMELLEPWQATR